jgi:hypothetical protein
MRELLEILRAYRHCAGFCYLAFVCLPHGEIGRVKIGSSERPLHRFRTLQPLSPYELKVGAIFPGGEALERALHRFFEGARAHHEWFDLTPLLLWLSQQADPAALEHAPDLRQRSTHRSST